MFWQSGLPIAKLRHAFVPNESPWSANMYSCVPRHTLVPISGRTKDHHASKQQISEVLDSLVPCTPLKCVETKTGLSGIPKQLKTMQSSAHGGMKEDWESAWTRGWFHMPSRVTLWRALEQGGIFHTLTLVLKSPNLHEHFENSTLSSHKSTPRCS